MKNQKAKIYEWPGESWKETLEERPEIEWKNKITANDMNYLKHRTDVDEENMMLLDEKIESVNDKFDTEIERLEIDIDKKQDTLVSGTNIRSLYFTAGGGSARQTLLGNTDVNIKSVNGQTLTGFGNVDTNSTVNVRIDALTNTVNLNDININNRVDTVDNKIDNVNTTLNTKIDDSVSSLNTRIDNTNTALSNKQDRLVSGSNIKTINNQSILGAGNIDVSGGSVPDLKTINGENLTGTGNIEVQPVLESGKNIHTLYFRSGTGNPISMLGSGDINFASINNHPLNRYTDYSLQEPLVSGNNIKTLNNKSLLGSGEFLTTIFYNYTIGEPLKIDIPNNVNLFSISILATENSNSIGNLIDKVNNLNNDYCYKLSGVYTRPIDLYFISNNFYRSVLYKTNEGIFFICNQYGSYSPGTLPWQYIVRNIDFPIRVKVTY